jgi:carbon-monoxide dehydrogenase iron sulfur subunit
VKKIYVREEVCIGCRLCEIFCIVQNSKSKKIIKVFKSEFPRPLPRIMVEEKGPVSFALQCRHCDDAPCIDACITGAMSTERGVVVCDESRCVGCWMCIMVCPYGVIKRDLTSGKLASKCNLCSNLEVPACVSHCPNGALTYE